MHWTDILVEHGAKCWGLEWARGYETPEEAWDACPRGDWMLWWCGLCAGGPWSGERQKLVWTLCECLDESLQELPEEGMAKAARKTLTKIFYRVHGDYCDHQRARDAYAVLAAYAIKTATNADNAAACSAACAVVCTTDTASITARLLRRCAEIVRKAYPVHPQLNRKPTGNE